MRFHVRRSARRRLSAVAALTVDVRVDLDLDGTKETSAYIGEPPAPDGYVQGWVGATRVFVRSTTFTGSRLTQLPPPAAVTIWADRSGGLRATATFAPPGG